MFSSSKILTSGHNLIVRIVNTAVKCSQVVRGRSCHGDVLDVLSIVDYEEGGLEGGEEQIMVLSVFCAAAYGLDVRYGDTCLCGPKNGQQITLVQQRVLCGLVSVLHRSVAAFD